MNKLYYAKGYKNQVRKEDFAIDTGIQQEKAIVTEFYSLFPSGLLVAHVGCAWDGSSGPTIDSRKDKIASLVHDIFYWMMQSGELSWEHKDAADRLYRFLCVAGGMSRFRSWLRYRALRRAGGKFTKLFGDKHRVRCAP